MAATLFPAPDQIFTGGSARECVHRTARHNVTTDLQGFANVMHTILHHNYQGLNCVILHCKESEEIKCK